MLLSTHAETIGVNPPMTDDTKRKDSDATEALPACVSRREFMLFAGATTLSLATLGITVDSAFGDNPVAARVAEYPRMKIGDLRSLTAHEPQLFYYPYDEPHCASLPVKLDARAGGGIGPDEDIVAFNQLCTHQGGTLEGQYQSAYRVLGPCPMHLTTFDLTRYGMVVSGHATQGLPQILLSVEDNDIIATGVMGLIYGYADNRADLERT